MLSEKELARYANVLCGLGRDYIARGQRKENSDSKKFGLVCLTAGLIQQSPLRVRSDNSLIFGKEKKDKTDTTSSSS